MNLFIYSWWWAWTIPKLTLIERGGVTLEWAQLAPSAIPGLWILTLGEIKGLLALEHL